MVCNCKHESSDHNWEGHPFLRFYTNCRLCDCKKFERRKTFLESIGFDDRHKAVVCLLFYAIAFVCGIIVQDWAVAGDRRNLAYLEAKYGYVGYELVNEITFCYYAYDQSHGTDNRCPFWINEINSAIIP